MVTIFHLSDLHIVDNSQWEDMKDEFLAAIPELAPDGEKLLIVTGDFHNFNESNYHHAIEFLEELIKAMGIDRHKDVFVIPGNHDVGSEAAVKEVFSSKRGWRTTTSKDKAWKKWDAKQRDTVELLRGNNNEKNFTERVKVRLEAYTPYCTFVRSLNIYLDEKNLLPASVHVRTWRERLNLLHLNTTLVADGSGEKKDQQLDIITAKSSQIWDGVNTDLPALALGHNSFVDLLEEQQEKLKDVFLKHGVCAYLCGDTHKLEERSSKNARIELDLGRGSMRGNIPNVVGMKGAADPTDGYSDFGFYLHQWDEEKNEVKLIPCRWSAKDNRPRFIQEYSNDDRYFMPRPRFGATSSKKGSPFLTTHPNEYLEASLTLARVFKAAACYKNIAAWDDFSNRYLVSKPEDASPELMLRYLGVSAKLLDCVAADIRTDMKGFVLYNRWNVAITFNTLLNRYSTILGSIWGTIKSNISMNLQDSLATSTYFDDNGFFPKTVSDLQGHRGEAVQPQGNRWNAFAERICPGVEDILKNSPVGSDFFKGCNTSITIERAVDGITALVLACFFYCQVNAVDESTARVKMRYRNHLQELIHDKFGYAPPDDGEDDMLITIRNVTRVVSQNLPYYWPENKKEDEFSKILYEELNMNYRDDNSHQSSQSKSL